MSIELKNCPFCGRKSEIVGDDFSFVHCTCGISSIPLENWNNRPLEDNLARRVDELSDMVAMLTGKKKFRGDETILYAAYCERRRRFEARIAELEKSLREINQEINHIDGKANESEMKKASDASYSAARSAEFGGVK